MSDAPMPSPLEAQTARAAVKVDSAPVSIR